MQRPGPRFPDPSTLRGSLSRTRHIFIGFSEESFVRCVVPPPRLREQRPCENSTGYCCRNCWNRGIWRFRFLVVPQDQVFYFDLGLERLYFGMLKTATACVSSA
uniref:Uncharacterized protein n=1 Tax=Eutreptiella gymnastica TaxID=73025 RepID=A0A7S4LB42_9EUGL